MGKSGKNKKYIKKLKFLKWQNRCYICDVHPNKTVLRHLVDNMEPIVHIQRKDYVLCDICEAYFHFNCLCYKLKLNKEEKERFKTDLKARQTFSCYICQLETVTPDVEHFLEPRQ